MRRNALGKHEDARVLVIEPSPGFLTYWSDVLRYRDLFFILAWRDLSVRYKQTAIGVLWTLIRPLLTMLILTFAFERIAKMPSIPGVPYSVLVLSALVPWFLFSSVLSEAAFSLAANANLITKVYFPRVILPAAAAVVALFEALINAALLLALMWLLGPPVSWHVFTAPIFLGAALLVSLGPALFLTALNVKYRDFRYVIPFFLQFGLYVTPVGFATSAVPEGARFWYSLNPMVGVIDGFRWATLGGRDELYIPALVSTLTFSIGGLYFGLKYFRSTERSFADVV